mmetsp:Transcript_46881/g.111596  ORF Transcript_46881/g.111596 Transcript_46881/m.111596 type:complete len:615 (+) Transcript_46881:133-1977(+)
MVRSKSDKMELNVSVTMQAPEIESDSNFFGCGVAYYNLLINVHTWKTGSRSLNLASRMDFVEYSWSLRRRYSDFERLYHALAALSEEHNLAKLELNLPQKTYLLRGKLGVEALALERATPLGHYLKEVLQLAVDAGVPLLTQPRKDAGRSSRLSEEGLQALSTLVHEFLGLEDRFQDEDDSDTSNRLTVTPDAFWRLPKNARRRELYKGGGPDPHHSVGDHVLEEYGCKEMPLIRRNFQNSKLGGLSGSNAFAHRANDKLPAHSRGSCIDGDGVEQKPSRSRWPMDARHRRSSLPSFSRPPKDTDEVSPQTQCLRLPSRLVRTVWMETPFNRLLDTATRNSQDDDRKKAAIEQAITNCHIKAAVCRDLSMRYDDKVHPILGYGMTATETVVVLEVQDGACTLYDIKFGMRACQTVLRQCLEALDIFHAHDISHGFLTTESIVVNQKDLSVRLAWAPGLQRHGSPAMIGFRPPVAAKADPMRADLFALACVILAWSFNFEPPASSAPPARAAAVVASGGKDEKGRKILGHPWLEYLSSSGGKLEEALEAAYKASPGHLPAPKKLTELSVNLFEMNGGVEYDLLEGLIKVLSMIFTPDPTEPVSIQMLLSMPFFNL